MIAKKVMWPMIVCLGGLSVLVACGAAEPTATPIPPTPEFILDEYVDPVTTNPTAMPLPTGSATEVTAQLMGSAVIHLAGRSDVPFPLTEPLPEGMDVFCRGAIVETPPIGWQIAPDSTFTFQATGQINFYGGYMNEGTLPDGKPEEFSEVTGLGGITAYYGPKASMIGLFLDDQLPTGTAPEALRYSGEQATVAITDATFNPVLGQLFFIGDGLTGIGTGEPQTFVAPAGATRLYLGFADSADFMGNPGCYGDNIGAFMVKITGSQPFSPLVNR